MTQPRLLLLAMAVVLCAVGCHSSGTTESAQAIPRALVSANGKVITVPAQGGGCVTKAVLHATETAQQVQLRLDAVMPVDSVACSANSVLLQATTTLPEPLAGRRLIDVSTQQPIPYLSGADLARVGWLPPGASRPANSTSFGWTRTYTFAAGASPIAISQSQGGFVDPGEFGADAGRRTVIRVNGYKGLLIIDGSPQHPEQDRVGWHVGPVSLDVESSPVTAGQRAFPPSVIERVARGLTLPKSAPTDASLKTLVPANCERPGSDPSYKPRRMVVACDGDAVFQLLHIRYAVWRGDLATGRAVERFNGCQPSCAAGHEIDRAVTFRLRDVRDESHQPMFSQIAIRGPERAETGAFDLWGDRSGTH